jgi:uncharacterized damage-inducible protein DinB
LLNWGVKVMLGYLREMFLFDDWANRETLRSLQEMEHPPERARKVMAHIMAAELLWMARLQQAKQAAAVRDRAGEPAYTDFIEAVRKGKLTVASSEF